VNTAWADLVRLPTQAASVAVPASGAVALEREPPPLLHEPEPRPARLSLTARLRARLVARWPRIRRQLPRDLLIMLWLGLLAQAFGLAWVSTDSVRVQAALVIKGAPVRPGELAVFLYQGDAVPDYYPAPSVALPAWLRALVGANADDDARAGPKKGAGFVKFLWGVPGDRVEVEDDEVFLTNRAGRWSMGKVKPRAKNGAALSPVASQVIPPGYVYMWAPHHDALDSRYSLLGLVPVSSIAGRAVKLW
jgi:conjugal transfer pilin signal peptidase TrbI